MDRFLAVAVTLLSIVAMWLIIYDHLFFGWSVLAVVLLCWARLTRITAR